MILEKIQKPSDLKTLTLKEKEALATEIRETLIKNISKTGGHLASNLGVVELTIALYSNLDLPKDKVVWDVGHQTYIAKMLTGRYNKFHTLRKKGGLSGFPKTEESIYDSFNTGHSSTSISVALGMARARDILKKDNKVVAVIGDGALTGGMAIEALNDAGISKNDLIVILNDNEMSISKNSGGLSKFLSRLRTKRTYLKLNTYIRKEVNKIPYLGKKITRIVTKIKSSIKELVIPKMYFENIGFKYIGPLDGHNIEELIDTFERIDSIKGPILIHVVTTKGKGYKYAELEPNRYHSVSSFDIEKGIPHKKQNDYSHCLGDKLVEMARENKKIVAITAAMEEGTGLEKFAKKYKDRFFDVEIAEQHAITLAAGMASTGLIPIIPIYSSFLQRAYDNIVHDIALGNLHVIICIDRAGIVGSDGETHQGLLDISFLNTIPNMTIMSPKNYEELNKMLEFSINAKGPIAIRYPRGNEEDYIFKKCNKVEIGKAEILKTGEDITIIGLGKMVAKACVVAEKLSKDGINAEVINIRFAKPIDKKTINKSIKKTGKIITIEDGYINGGFGEQIKKEFAGIASIINLGYKEKFIKQGTIEEIEHDYGLDIENIYKEAKKFVELN